MGKLVINKSKNKHCLSCGMDWKDRICGCFKNDRHTWSKTYTVPRGNNKEVLDVAGEED